MGRPKQLLPIEGRPLLVRSVATALAAGCRPVVVVLGRDADACSAVLLARFCRNRTGRSKIVPIDAPRVFRPRVGHRYGRLRIVRNFDWASGMGSSLRTGARALGNISAAYVLLCDQPGVTAETLKRLYNARLRTDRPVCVAAYADTVGPPLLVGGRYLRNLRGWPHDGGAKSLWTSNPADVTRVDCPEAADDLDTPDAYAAWLVRRPRERCAGNRHCLA